VVANALRLQAMPRFRPSGAGFGLSAAPAAAPARAQSLEKAA
jgi:hypothetical protein